MTKKNILFIFLLACLVVVLAVALTHLPQVGAFLAWIGDIFTPIILGLCMAFVLNVIMSTIEKYLLFWLDRFKKPIWQTVKRASGIILTFVVVAGFVYLVALVIIPAVTEFIDIAVKELPVFFEKGYNWLIAFLAKNDIEFEFIDIGGKIKWTELVNKVIEWLNLSTDRVVSVTTGIFSTIFDLILALILSIYVLASKERIRRFFHRLMKAILPSKNVKWIEKVSKLTYDSFASFITGQFTEAIVLGLLCFFGMLIFKFPLASVVSVVIGITALIPIFGAWIGGAVGTLFILMYDPVKAFFFLIFLVGLQQIETNIIYPKIVGDSIGLPGLIVLACVTVGGGLGGVAGLLISVPVTSVVYTLIKEFVDVTLEKKRLEKERLLALEAERAATEEQAATHEASVGEASAETPASDTPAN
jgi:predicted PurR-regulated permease PerM